MWWLSPDGDALLDEDELRVAAPPRDLGVDERIHSGHRREPGLDPRVLAVRALSRAADADPAGDMAGLDARVRGRA